MSSNFWQRLSLPLIYDARDARSSGVFQGWHGTVKAWITADVLTVMFSLAIALFYERHTGNVAGLSDFYDGTISRGSSVGLLLAVLTGFIVSLVAISRRLQLYTPKRLSGILREQGYSLQACFTAGLLLTGALYLIHGRDIPRSIVLVTIGVVTVLLSVRRLIYRIAMYRRFRRGVGTRDVLIVGTGPEAQALRHHLESVSHLGYKFKGFVCASNDQSTDCEDIVGDIETLFQHARRHFVDEIFITSDDRGLIAHALEEARTHGVDLRVVPELYGGLAWSHRIEYVGQFPTVPLHCGQAPELALLMKRLIDIVVSALAVFALSPLLLAIAIAIKLDSPGPVFYCSERIGKKARVFRCIKFRTMVTSAEQLRETIMHMNERDGVLFKVTNDPRITRLGRHLRKYSLDELPQLFNVLRGSMSIVGPRPPLASEVREYKLDHLRRLDVMPGITGLWQIVGRQDPSFESYISLDVTYVENWTIWMDLIIMLRTIGVVLSGTGS